MITKILSVKTKRTILTALAAGALALFPQTGFALPTGGVSGTATIDANGTVMDITGSATNNVIKWSDFSINTGESVNFNDANNYLNLVVGNRISNIFGAITGEGGDIYLINPNGILFGKGASVNIGAGNFYASTANVTGNDFDTLKTGIDACYELSVYLDIGRIIS